jgi:hypothetical protein
VSWTTPKTWVTGERLSAFDFNSYWKNDLLALFRAADERISVSWRPTLYQGESNVWEVYSSTDVVIPYSGSAWVIIEHLTEWGNFLSGTHYAHHQYTLDGAALSFNPDVWHLFHSDFNGKVLFVVFGAVFHVTSGPTTLQAHAQWYTTGGAALDINASLAQKPAIVRVMTLVS